MPKIKPVARLALDSRSWGPAFCESCDSDVEDVLLMPDMTVLCPDCMTPVEDFDEIGTMFTSARALCGEEAKYKKGPTHPDPVALLAFDANSWGPLHCAGCGADYIEDVVLTSSATFLCDECLTPIDNEDFEVLSIQFTSASDLCKGAVSPDSSGKFS
jgi:hypothetical protein